MKSPLVPEIEENKQPKRVEVLIASYNTSDLLRDCLNSLFEHARSDTGLKLDAAVFENASRDDSAQMVAQDFPHVRLVRSPTNVGFARANNLLAASSTADYLMLLNSDVVLTMDVVSPLLGVLDSDPAIAIVGPMLKSADGSVQPSSQRFPDLRFEFATLLGSRLKRLCPSSQLQRRLADGSQNIEQRAVTEERIHDADHLWATCWLLRRSDVARDGLFDETFVTYDEDLDYCRRLRAAGRRLVWVPDAQLVHLGGQSSDAFTKLALQAYGRRRYYFRHHGILAGLTYTMIANATIVGKRIHAHARAVKKSLLPAGWRAPSSR